MRWASTASTNEDTAVALAEACSGIETGLEGQEPDLVLVFCSPHHAEAWGQVAIELGERFAGATLLGCSAGGVIGGGREIEAAPGLALTAAALPDVTIHTFALDDKELPSPDQAAAGWTALLEIDPDHDPTFILLPDPFTCDGIKLIDGLDLAFPGQVKLGGLASGGVEPGECRLLLDGAVRRSGVVGVALVGDVEVDTVVTQGCRPSGPELVVTAAQGHTLISLDGQPALTQLDSVFSSMSEEDQQRFRHGPMLGLSIPGAGPDGYIIRNLVGMDRAHGVLMVRAQLQVGQRVRFHVRDAEVARQELITMLGACTKEPAGALLFSCLGRGARFFGLPDHDTEVFRSHMGSAPLGGFFCNGEIGPVYGRTWLHGYTSAFGLFRSRGWD